MAHFCGKYGVVRTCDSGDVGGVQTVVGARNWEYRGVADTVDATHFFSAEGGWRDSLPCLIGPAEISFDVVMDDSDDFQAAAAPALIEGNVIDFELDTDGGPFLQISGSAIVTELSISNPHDDTDTYRVSAVIQGEPALTIVEDNYSPPGA